MIQLSVDDSAIDTGPGRWGRRVSLSRETVAVPDSNPWTRVEAQYSGRHGFMLNAAMSQGALTLDCVAAGEATTRNELARSGTRPLRTASCHAARWLNRGLWGYDL